MAKTSASDILVLSQLKEINRKLTLVLVNQKEIMDELAGKLPIIPELEEAIRGTREITDTIDRKVPDKPNKKK
jgi:hypothetical protein